MTFSSIPLPQLVGPLRLLLRYSLIVLLLQSCVRAMLAMIHADRVNPLGAWFEIAVTGLRVDLIALGWALALPLLLLPLCAWRPGAAAWAGISRCWLTVVLAATVMLEAASPGFLREYEVRPNRLFLDYLERMQEVLPMLWQAFRGSLLFGIAATAATLLLGWRWFALPAEQRALPARQLLLWPVLIVVCALMIRSSLMHRPANPALFAKWNDTLVNQIALNGAYSLGYAVYATRHEADVARIYDPLEEAELLEWIRRETGAARSAAHPLWRRLAPSSVRARPLNLVVVVEESLGAGFSARLGGEGLTPRLDEWSSQGWWFTQLYATGTRSARGLEAIVAGFPPSPMQSVLKLPKAQTRFATLASVLGSAGYRSEFIYGGESHFDNMRGFFLGNGFDAVIDQGDYPQPEFRGTWGVSDEDLFARVQTRTEALHAGGQPYFVLAVTSSNHTPFEYPAGHIEPVGAANTVHNAIRFADHALGKYLDQAARSEYFRDTLILVVADHDVRVYGDDIVPLQRFRVPGLLLGADTRPRTIDSIASQIDLAPTLLSVMGVDAFAPFPGRDLTRTLPEFGVKDGPTPRAVMQFNDRFACLQPGLLSVLLPGGAVQQYRVGADDSQTPLEQAAAGAREHPLSEVHMPAWIYQTGAYNEPNEQLD